MGVAGILVPVATATVAAGVEEGVFLLAAQDWTWAFCTWTLEMLPPALRLVVLLLIQLIKVISGHWS